MGFNLTGTQVKNTYQKLAQISGSVLTNGTGSVITNLNVIASNATNAVNATFAVTASYAAYAVSASHEIIKEVSSSYADTAGVANSVSFTNVSGKPTGLVSSSVQIVIGTTIGSLDGSRVTGAVAGTVAYSNVTSKPTLVSGSAQIVKLGFAITGSNTFRGDQEILGSVTASSATVEKVEGTGSLSLKPSPTDFRAFQIYNTAPADIHIKGNSDYAFFGDDTNYLKIDNPAGQVSIEATNRIFLDTDSTVIGDLNVSGTFYPNEISFLSSSITQNTGSYVLTTDSNGTVQFDTYQQVAKAVQGDIQINSVVGNLSGSRVVGAVANATAAVSASHALNANTATSATSATNATNSLNAQDILLYVRNTSGAIIPKGRVVRITGATGDTPEIGLAEPTSERLSANSIGITNEQIAINGFGYVMLEGRLLAITTTGWAPGTNLYLGTSGTLSITPSTAPNATVRLGQVLRTNATQGSMFVKVDNGYEISELHDVVISSPSGSGDLLQFDGTVWRNAKSLTGNYQFGGTQTFNNINVNGTGSFAYLQQVTGSVKRIGDAFIQVNTDSPSQRFGGLKVVDSGSLQTGSIMWDSVGDHWIYENTAGGSYKAGGFMSGPRSTDIYNVQYPTVNKVLKGQGGDHLTDSSITDTGVKVDFSTNVIVTGSVTASSGFVGSLTGNADTATSATSAASATTASYVSGQENYARKDQPNYFTQDNRFQSRTQLLSGANVTGSITFNTTQYEGIDLMQGVFSGTGYSNPIRFFSGSVKRDYALNKWINMQTTPGSLPWLAISSFPENDHFMYFQPAYTSGTGRNRIAFESQIAGYGAGLQINDNTNITGSLRVSSTSTFSGNTTTQGIATQNQPSVPVDNGINTMVTVTGNQFVNVAPFATSTQAYPNSRQGFVNQTRGSQYRMAYATENYNNTSLNNTTWGSGFYSNGRGHTLDLIPTGSTNFNNKSFITLQQGTLGTTNFGVVATSISMGGNPSVTTGTISLGNASLPTLAMTAQSGSFNAITNSRFNNVRVNGTLGVNGNTTLTGTLTVGNKTTFNDQVVGTVLPLTIGGGTATMDCSIGNFFTLTLASGANTILSPSNIHAGQTINVQITQNGTTAGTISFPSTVKFTDGIDYVATTSLNAIDVVTLVSFDGTNLLATAVKNLQ